MTENYIFDIEYLDLNVALECDIMILIVIGNIIN